MKFLIDQNISPKVTQFVRNEGYDVIDIRELDLQGAPDEEILIHARESRRIVITLDKDFSNLKLLRENKQEGAIVLRTRSFQSNNIIGLLTQLLQKHTARDITGHLIIITENNTRFRAI